MSPSMRNASGDLISIIHETNEPQSQYSSYNGSNSVYPPLGLGGNISYPNTPDLTRSDSYDSRGSGSSSHEPASPLTPSSAYQEPLFSNSMHEGGKLFLRSGPKDVPEHLYNGRLPPISYFTSAAASVVPESSAVPDALYRRRSSFQDSRMVRQDSQDQYMRPTMSRMESTIQRSVEPSDEFTLRTPHTSAALEPSNEDEEMVNSSASKKCPKPKTGTTKRYPCKFKDSFNCDKTFTTSGHASRHAKIHIAEKTVPCKYEGCGRRFTRVDNMKQHYETHKKEKSRASTRHTGPRRPSAAVLRRRSSSSRSSIGRFSVPRDSPPLMSPGLYSAPMLSPALPAEASARPALSSRTPSSGLDALAMVAATEQASVEQHEAQRHAEQHNAAMFHYYRQ